MPTEDKGKRRVTPEAREAFRLELIAIARHIFLTEGHAAVTIRPVTSVAGVTPMAFYWYFSNKDALLCVIWDGIVQECARHCADEAGTHAPPQRFEAYVAAFADYWLAHRDYFRFIFLSDAQGTDFIGLRRELFEREGMQLHFQQLDALLQAHLSDLPQAHARTRTQQMRALTLYKAMGFLHMAIGILDQAPQEAQAQRALMLQDLRQGLAHWSSAP